MQIRFEYFSSSIEFADVILEYEQQKILVGFKCPLTSPTASERISLPITWTEMGKHYNHMANK